MAFVSLSFTDWLHIEVKYIRGVLAEETQIFCGQRDELANHILPSAGPLSVGLCLTLIGGVSVDFNT